MGVSTFGGVDSRNSASVIGFGASEPDCSGGMVGSGLGMEESDILARCSCSKFSRVEMNSFEQSSSSRVSFFIKRILLQASRVSFKTCKGFPWYGCCRSPLKSEQA